MNISHAYRAIFIHPAKCGGSSIRKAFKATISGTGDYSVPFRHSSPKDSREYIGDNIWKSFYKFTVMRNPFMRLVSWYQHPIRFNTKKIVRMEMSSGKVLEKEEAKYGTIDKLKSEIDYIRDVRNFSKTVDYWITDEYKEKMAQTKMKFYIFENMVDWLNDGDGINFRRIIRVENMEEDWKLVCDEIKIRYVKPFNKNIGYIGQSELIYKDFYTPELVKKVSKLYEKDMEYFGYRFE